MAAPATKQRYSIQIVILQQINNNDKYQDLGKLLVAIPSNVTFLDFIASAKKKIDKKYGKRYTLNYEEQTGLQLFIRPKQDENIKEMKLKWSEIIDFDEPLNDYVLQPNDEVIVFLFNEQKQSLSPKPVPLDPMSPSSITSILNKSIPCKPNNNNNNIKSNASKMAYTTIKNNADSKFYKIRIRYFMDKTGGINEILKEFPKDITIGDVKKELSFISGINARLQYKPIPNIIDSNKCICYQIKRQSMLYEPVKIKKVGVIKSIKVTSDTAICEICRNKLNDLCIECQANMISDNIPKTQCINAGCTDCEHIFHSHCIHRWLKTRDSCPLDNKLWKFQYETEKEKEKEKENDDNKTDKEERFEIIDFYYKKLNNSLLEHIELNKKKDGIDFNKWTINDLCERLKVLIDGIRFNDKRLFVNQINITFKNKNIKLKEIGFDINKKNIFHICGCKKHQHSLTLNVEHIKFEYIENNDDDEKKQNDNNNKNNNNNKGIKIIKYGNQKFEGVLSSMTMNDIKTKIELVMDIKKENQSLYQLNKLNEYEFIENDSQISEICELKENLQIFVECNISPINCTFDVFCNGYLLPNHDNNYKLFDLFNPFQNDTLYISPRWIYRKGAFIKKSILNSESYYQSSTENSTISDTLKLSASWIPFIPQTRKGMTSFLSALYVIIEHDISNKLKVLGMIRYLILNKFSPLLLSFKILLNKRLLQLTKHHKSALSNGFYYLFRNIIPKKICKDNSKVFQYSHLIFSYILGFCNDDKYKKYEKYKFKQLIDPITLNRLIDPVTITKKINDDNDNDNDNNNDGLILFIKTLTGKTIIIKENDSILIKSKIIKLNKKIKEKEGIPISTQQLIFKGKQLNSNNTLKSYDIKNKNTLHLVLTSNVSDNDEDEEDEEEENENEDEDDEEEEEIVYSRKTVFEKFKNLTNNDIIPNHEISLLLQSYNVSNEVYIWDWNNIQCVDYKYDNDEKEKDELENEETDSLTTSILSRLGISWFDITNSIGNNKDNKMMKIIPTLSIKNLSTQSKVLTLDCNGNLCALCGAVKDDKNNRMFFLPLYRDLYTTDLDKLANDINQLNLNIDTDSWIDIEDDDTIDDRQPLEAIVVCFDRSYSMQESCFGDNMSRLDVVKCYWSAFLNRSKAYDYANHIGLIVFDSCVETKCRLSPLYERFRKKVEEIQVRGCTALRDAMKEGTKQLIEWKLSDHIKRKNCKLRIIVLTDGEDNQSSINDINLTQILLKADITSDAIMIGNHNQSLHAICSATGGYVFYPKSFRDGLRIFELETFLSITERGDLNDRKSTNYIYSQKQLNKYGETNIDICDDDNVPKGKIINNLQKKKPTVSLKIKIKKIEKSKDIKKKYNKKLKTRKVLREMNDILKDPHPFWDIYIEDENIFFWKLILCGPQDTPYQDGIFLLYMDFNNDYPEKAPIMRFITPIKHVNVNSYGRICHSIFDRNYNPDIKIRDILNNVYGLLLDPDWDDPLDSVLRQEYADNKDKFRLSVTKHVQKHSMKKTRQEFKYELSGDNITSTQNNDDDNNDNDNNNNNNNGAGWIPHNKDNQMDDKIV